MDLFSNLMAEARILALQRLVVGLLSEHLQCSLELADARFHEEWERCFEILAAKLLASHPSALHAELLQQFQQEKFRWLNPE